MLNLQNLETFYGETQVLHGVSLKVGQGEVVALLGPNGAGKTTTLRSILGLTPARRGVIDFDGRNITRFQTHDIARAGIGWVPDDRRIFPTLTVERNLSIAKKKTRFRSWELKEMFEIFSALEHFMTREAANLSGGEMQMVAISRALLGSPGLPLCDEPTQGLGAGVVNLPQGGEHRRCHSATSGRLAAHQGHQQGNPGDDEENQRNRPCHQRRKTAVVNH